MPSTSILRRRLFRRWGESLAGCRACSILCLSIAVAFSPHLCAQDEFRSPSELKKLSLEELADVEIISSGRRPEPLSQAASAIDVITADDIERAGVTNI